MRVLGRCIALVALVIWFAVACEFDSKSTIVSLSTNPDTLSFSRQGDSVVTTVDTTITPTGDTVVVTRVDTIFAPPDTVLITRFDTVISGTDTVITTVVDTLVEVDTVIVTTVDTIVRYDTIVVQDTIVVPAATLNLSVSQVSILVGASTTVSATLYNHLGYPIPTGTLNWFSENSSIASVNGGTILGVAPGSTRVFVVAGTASANLPVQVTSPPVQPPPPGPTGTSYRNANRPAGLTTRIDDNFDRGLPAGSSNSTISSWVSAGGWSGAGIWRSNLVKTVTDASGPNGFTGKRNLWSTAPTGTSPGGAISLTRTLGGARSLVYVYISFKFEPGYDHNTNSEKLIYFDNTSQNIIFEYLDGHQVFYHIDDPTNRYPGDSGGYLRANQEPNGRLSTASGGYPIAPPPTNGTWQQIEILMDSNANTVQWWVDGRLYASYTNVTGFNPISEIMLDDTWGGSGSKSNSTSGRIVEQFLIATN